jgi:hypothetical protein
MHNDLSSKGQKNPRLQSGSIKKMIAVYTARLAMAISLLGVGLIAVLVGSGAAR